MDDGQIDDVAEAVIGAFHAGDQDALRLLLHPYLHWTDAGGRRIRGRTKVLNLLDEAADLGSPAAIELRDGQVYRWTVATGPSRRDGAPGPTTVVTIDPVPRGHPRTAQPRLRDRARGW